MGDRYALPEFSIVLTKRQRNIQEKLLKIYTSAGIETPITEHVMEGFPSAERLDANRVLESLISSGELILLTPQVCLHKSTYASVCQAAQAHFQSESTLTLAQLRDMLGTSRKYSQAIIEYFDKVHITRKEEDLHYLDQGF